MKIYFDLFVIHRTTFSLYKFETTYPVFPLVWKKILPNRLLKNFPNVILEELLRLRSGQAPATKDLKVL